MDVAAAGLGGENRVVGLAIDRLAGERRAQAVGAGEVRGADVGVLMDQFAGGVAGHHGVRAGARDDVDVDAARPIDAADVEQRLHAGVGVPRQRRPRRIVGHEVAGRDQADMVVLHQRRQGVLDRRDLVGGDVAERGEDQGVVVGELGQVGEIGLGQQVVGHAGGGRLVLGRHEELGIGGCAEVLGGRGCREDDADLVAGVGDDRQGGGVDDGVGTGGVVSGQEGGVVDVGQDVDRRGGAADLGQRQAELDGGLVGAERVGQGRGAGEGLTVGTRVEVGLAVRREGDVVVVAAIGSENLVAGEVAPVRCPARPWWWPRSRRALSARRRGCRR